MAVMRSVFYVPANNEKFVEKSPTFDADIITFDMEDAVPPSEKENARRMTRENLEFAGQNGAEVYVRINGWDTGLTEDDLVAVVWPGLHGITLPKTANAEEVHRLEKRLEELEKERGMEVGSVKISVLLETAMGALNCGEICFASDRVVSAIFGAVDYCRDMRVRRTDSAEEQLYARAAVGVAARAAGIVAIDAPFPNYKDMDAFIKNLEDGKQLGYEGRMLIHPSQIEVANKLYAPSDEEVEWAKKIVKLFEEEGLAKGKASINVDGAMVDTPIYLNAKDILNTYEEIRAKKK